MPLKVAGVTIVNSTANVQTSTLPDTGITTGNFGNTTFVVTANVTSRGIVNAISSAEVSILAYDLTSAVVTISLPVVELILTCRIVFSFY